MSKSCKEFSLSATIKNISRFVDVEDYYTDTEERFNIPWKMFIFKCGEYFELGLVCEKDSWENRKWLIETDCTMKVVSHNGKSMTGSRKFIFNNSGKRGVCLMEPWDLLESDYAVDDSIVVEAYVKIIKITDLPCHEDEKTFLLSNTVKNISSIKEGDCYYTEIATRHNIPWRMQIKRDDGFVNLYLRCEKEEQRERDWNIELNFELRLVSLNGHSVHKFIRWNDMEEKYLVNDSIIIEARGKITSMTGFDNEPSSADLEDEFSECVINVGGQNYTVKKQ